MSKRRNAILAAAVLALTLAGGGAMTAASGASSPGGRIVAMVAAPQDVGRGGAADPSTRAGERRARARIAAVVRQSGLGVARSIPELGVLELEVTPGQGLADTEAALRRRPGVVTVEPAHLLSLRRMPDDPALHTLDENAPGGTYAQWNMLRQRLPRAWDYSQGRGVPVAVVDTGADAANRDLSPRIVKAVDQVRSGNAKADTNGHGTHVSGLACGTADNGYGIAGAGYRCDLIEEKAAMGDTLDDVTVAESINDAVNRGARVINMSFGDENVAEDSSPVLAAINRAWDHDVVMVAAALNKHLSGSQGYPAKYLQPAGTGDDLSAGKGLVVTGAYYDGRNADTGYGSGVSLAAFGFSKPAPDDLGVLSDLPPPQIDVDCTAEAVCLPGDRCSCRPGSENHLGYMQGTSMATPQVAGAAALVRAYRPALSARKVIRVLKRRASGDGHWSNQLGWGILDAGAALKDLAPANCIFHWASRHRAWHESHRHARASVHRRWHRHHPSCTQVR